MTSSSIRLLSILALSAGLAACDGDSTVRINTDSDNAPKGVLKVVDALQCPQTSGALTRKGSASAGGEVCSYVGPKGAEVTLHLVKLDGGSVDEVLNAFEGRLSREMPAALAQMDRARAEASADGARAVAQSGVNISANGDDARVSLPGLHIETKGESASVNIGGLHINADDSTGAATVKADTGGDQVNVEAHGNVAQVRTREAGPALRATWMITDSEPAAGGWRLVGYEARGPERGPVVVAVVRSKDRRKDDVFDDARDLVTLNVGE